MTFHVRDEYQPPAAYTHMMLCVPARATMHLRELGNAQESASMTRRLHKYRRAQCEQADVRSRSRNARCRRRITSGPTRRVHFLPVLGVDCEHTADGHFAVKQAAVVALCPQAASPSQSASQPMLGELSHQTPDIYPFAPQFISAMAHRCNSSCRSYTTVAHTEPSRPRPCLPLRPALYTVWFALCSSSCSKPADGQWGI
ncbi:hypothetical protein GE09DRAFT_633009 [Coniochaeta sp. 2T2.1]|nr:hypothetical protein GE09DRAFT_633009 [Coniochaeta sp. 2T2.1]